MSFCCAAWMIGAVFGMLSGREPLPEGGRNKGLCADWPQRCQSGALVKAASCHRCWTVASACEMQQQPPASPLQEALFRWQTRTSTELSPHLHTRIASSNLEGFLQKTVVLIVASRAVAAAYSWMQSRATVRAAHCKRGPPQGVASDSRPRMISMVLSQCCRFRAYNSAHAPLFATHDSRIAIMHGLEPTFFLPLLPTCTRPHCMLLCSHCRLPACVRSRGGPTSK